MLLHISTEQSSQHKPSHLCLGCSLQLLRLLNSHKNKKSFHHSVLNETNPSHIRSLIHPILSPRLLGFHLENQIKAPELGCYKDTFQTQLSGSAVEFCAPICNHQEIMINVREILGCSTAKRHKTGVT